MKRFIIVAALMAVAAPMTSFASVEVCKDAPEAAYKFIERVYAQRPDVALKVVRTPEQTGMFIAHCEGGYRDAKQQESARLNAMYELIEVKAHQSKISPEEARYIIADMADALAFKFGYMEGIK